MKANRDNVEWNLFQFYREEEKKAAREKDELRRLYEQRKRRILSQRLTDAEP